ncbi:MAG: hypothetical protein HKO01_01225 [Flaviramulus sp.]|nr:hypothetical protein [Flaviramulus sp.]
MSYQVMGQSRKINKILENPEDRAYLMMKISNDKKLMTEMIDYLSHNVEAVEKLQAKYGNNEEGMMKKMSETKGQEHPKNEMCTMCKKKMAKKKQKENDGN